MIDELEAKHYGISQASLLSMSRFFCFAVVLLSAFAVSARGDAMFAMCVDDNKSPSQYREIARCFEDKGLRVTFAVNAAGLSAEQGACLKELSARGHEIADHTPSHDIFKVCCPTEALFARGRRLKECVEADPETRTICFRPQPTETILRFLADVTRDRFDAFGLPRPTAWIHPEGCEPRLSWALLKRVYGDEYGYRFADGGREPAPDGVYANERDREAFSMPSDREMPAGCLTLTDLTAELRPFPTNAAARFCAYRMTPDVVAKLKIEATPKGLTKDVVVSNALGVLYVDPSAAFAKGATVVRVETPASSAPKAWGELVVGYQVVAKGAPGSKMSFEVRGNRYDEYEKKTRGWSLSRAESRNVLDARFRRFTAAGRPDGKGVDTGAMAVTLHAGAPVAIRSLAFGSAELLDIDWPRRPRKAHRIFHACFDGTAKADLAGGAAEPLVAKGLSFAPGKKGQAVRLTRTAASELAYAIDGNFIPARHTVTFWVRREAFPSANVQTLFALPRVSGKAARGSGAFAAYLQKGNFVLPQMDDLMFTRSHEFAGDGDWHHVAMAFHENGGYSFYFDGKGNAWSSDYDNNPFCRAQCGTALRTFSHRAVFDRFFVGCRGASDQVDGLIDELTIYDGALGWKEVNDLYRAEGGPDLLKTDYAKLFTRLDRPNPYVAAAKAEPGLPDREVIERIVLDKPEPCARFRHVGPVTVKSLDGVPYLEAGSGRDNRFAVGFDIDPTHPLWCVEIDYPDDAKRTMGCVVQDAARPQGDYGGSVGIMCGDEYPPTGRIQTHRLYYWAGRGTRAAVVLRTCRPGAPAAVSEIRICKVKGSRLPDAGVKDAKPVRGWGRTVGYYFEDPSVVHDFALLPAQTADALEKLGERMAAVMRFTGMNLLCYPGAFYNGRIGDGYETRSHVPNYLGGLYERFDREGLGLMPTINQYEVRVPEGLEISHKTVHDGSLYSSPANIHATGRVNGRHSHGCPPNWNIVHPYVQAQIARDLDAYVEQGGSHPSFKGIGLHLAKHSILWMGSLKGGYNDYCIDAFEKSKKVKVRGEGEEWKGPFRGKLYYEKITGDPVLREKWMDWRCEVVTGFWIEQARRIKAKRADIRLFFNCFLMTNPDYAGYGEDGYHADQLRAGGLDVVRLTKACDNVVFGMTCVPSDYRHGAWAPGRISGRPELDIRQWEHGGFFDGLRQAAYPIVHQHERYFESAVGTQGKPGTPNAISCDWITEIPWRVTTVNPGGFYVLRSFVEPLKHQDLLGVTKGGFLIGTYGGEPYLAKFARAFRALPAVLFDDLPSENPDVTIRGKRVDGVDYAYVVNTSDRPQAVRVRLSGMCDLLTDEKLEGLLGKDGLLKLEPYELKSFGNRMTGER